MKKKAKRIAVELGNVSYDTKMLMLYEELQGKRYVVYSDGSFKDGVGGCAWVILHKGTLIKKSACSFEHDGNASVRAELLAVMYALRDCPPNTTIDVYVDCQAIIKKIAKGRLDDLKEEFESASKEKDIRLHWVRSHEGNVYNEMVDMMAFWAMKVKI